MENLIIEILNCNEVSIAYKYFTISDFLEKIESEDNNIPMLDDELLNVKYYGKQLDLKKLKLNTVDDLYNYICDNE